MDKDDHDAAYKCMFSYPRAVEDLLRDFVGDEWVEKVDFSSLERINGSFIDDKRRRRITDVIWKVRLADQDLYICLILEFQSKTDPTMALRVGCYVLNLYLDLYKNPKQYKLTDSSKLPPVLPIVMYNGAPRWSAPLEVDEMIDVGPGRLPDFRPHMRYMLLDQGTYQEQDLMGLENVVADIFRLENAENPEVWRSVLRKLLRYLAGPEHDGLRNAIKAWIINILIPAKFPQFKWPSAQLEEAGDLQGVEAMLKMNLDLWGQQYVQEGLEKGLEQGQANTVHRQLLRKFGPLPDWVEKQLSDATSEQWEEWGDQVLSASSIGEMFKQPEDQSAFPTFPQ
ncbi:transposase [Chitinimonas arctica]|uniref:Transposase n=1 Tax=Chitinimonas arctica TaxID=2594795 RepID=A0A516SBT0_9NEIS|nr:Rpn family recombination-promoting nuclease/putative transposase [Chitinimonas arctica]QDQ25604.1 transposase [Chitinimonas arctica]